MKLKKFAALAVAGAMAASTLAGCCTTNPGQNGNGTVQTGYSAAFGAMTNLGMDYVSYEDSPVDQAALKRAVDGCSDVQLLAALVGGNLDVGNGWLQGIMPIPADVDAVYEQTGVESILPCVTIFTQAAGLDKNADQHVTDDGYLDVVALSDLEDVLGKIVDESGGILGGGVNGLYKFAQDGLFGSTDILEPTKVGLLFVGDGTATVETTLSQISDMLESLINKQVNYSDTIFMWPVSVSANVADFVMPENNGGKSITINGGSMPLPGDSVGVDFHYTISVSVVGRTATSADGLLTAKMNFVAVTITRTGTLANEA